MFLVDFRLIFLKHISEMDLKNLATGKYNKIIVAKGVGLSELSQLQDKNKREGNRFIFTIFNGVSFRGRGVVLIRTNN